MKVLAAVCAAAMGAVARAGEDADGSISTDLEYVLPLSVRQKDVYHRDAMFGTPFSTSQELMGEVHYVPGDACDEESYKDLPPVKENEFSRIFLVNRGECTFAHKTRLAQVRGGAGVIVVNNKCMMSNKDKWGTSKWKSECEADENLPPEQTLPFMAYDGAEHDKIRIPAFLVTKYDGQKLKDCFLEKTGKADTEHGYVGVLSDSCSSDSKILVQFRLDIPPAEEKVSWELWLGADMLPEDFKMIAEVAKAIEANSEFAPKYLVFPPEPVGCTNAKSCDDLCLASERSDDVGFCVLTRPGTTGEMKGKTLVADVIAKLCVFENAKKKSQEQLWWQFEQALTACRISSPSDDGCKDKVLGDVSGLDSSAVNTCIKEETKSMSMLKEVATRRVDEMIFTDSLVVNKVRQDFGLTGGFVARALCDGFLEGKRPSICNCVDDNEGAVKTCLNAKCYDKSKPYNCPNTDVCVQNLADCVATSSGGIGGGTIFLILLVTGLAAGFFVYFRRARQQMQEEVRDILSEYVPLEAFSSRNDNGEGFARQGEGNEAVGVI